MKQKYTHRKSPIIIKRGPIAGKDFIISFFKALKSDHSDALWICSLQSWFITKFISKHTTQWVEQNRCCVTISYLFLNPSLGVPLLEWGSINLHNGTLHKGLGPHKLIVWCIVDHVSRQRALHFTLPPRTRTLLTVLLLDNLVLAGWRPSSYLQEKSSATL